METERINFPKVIPDNDESYFSLLAGVITSVDELASLSIVKTLTGYNFRICPSLPVYMEELINQIIGLHNLFGIKVDFSKSIKTSVTLHYSIKNQ